MTDLRKRCPTCRQFLPHRYPFDASRRFSELEKAVAAVIRKAGDNGILMAEIINSVYRGRKEPGDPRRVIWTIICRINKKILPKGLHIQGTRRGRGQPGEYVLQRVAS